MSGTASSAWPGGIFAGAAGPSNRPSVAPLSPQIPWSCAPDSFPDTPLAGFDSRQFFSKLDLDTLFFIFYYQQVSTHLRACPRGEHASVRTESEPLLGMCSSHLDFFLCFPPELGRGDVAVLSVYTRRRDASVALGFTTPLRASGLSESSLRLLSVPSRSPTR